MFPDRFRTLLLFLCTLCAYEVLGRTPGAISLRTRDMEVQLTAAGRPGRDLKLPFAWFERVS